MANPRELAEQAFALLQNALRASEARASDLDDQLKRQRKPKNRLEEQLDVLTHRLESVEAERARWEQQAGHLEEITEAERVKVAQLKKKLEIAEGGPEKLTKKEINFWKARAESIDTEITEYKNRLAALRRELNERDEAIARLEVTKAAGVPVARMRLVYVRASIAGPRGPTSQAHMVVAWYATPGAEPLILDNLDDRIRPASDRDDLLPIFSFNSEAIWSGAAANGRRESGSGDLNRWADLQRRSRAEGFD